jgi:hypothetical protein
MAWYALQVLSGEEMQISEKLNGLSIQTILPYNPTILKSASKIRLVYHPLLPGYIIANLQLPRDYFALNRQELNKKVIRICGNGHEAVSLTEDEITFFRLCSEFLAAPIKLKRNFIIELLDHPPEFRVEVDWYQPDKFKARLRITIPGVFKDHVFTTAAFDDDYRGVYYEQLQGLQNFRNGQFDLRQAGYQM